MDQFVNEQKKGLRLAQEQWLTMCQHTESLSPVEACGLLAGKGEEVLAVYPLTNACRSPVRFRMDPYEQLKTFDEIEAKGWDLLGIYHSHPDGPGYPSTTDIEEAYYPDAVYLILFPHAGSWGCRGFLIHQGEVDELAMQTKNSS